MASAVLSIASLSLQGKKGFSEFAGLRRSSASPFSANTTPEDFASTIASQTATPGGRTGYRGGPVEARFRQPIPIERFQTRTGDRPRLRRMADQSRPRVAINGLERTGMNFLRLLQFRPDSNLDVVALNGAAVSSEEVAHLLKHDSNWLVMSSDIRPEGDDAISINGRIVKLFSEPDPAKLPWKDLGIDLVIEATGKYVDKDGAGKHLIAGAKKVIIAENGKEDIPIYVSGVNTDTFDEPIIRIGSPTTVCVTPLVKFLDQKYGIIKGSITAVQAYRNDQNLVDGYHPTDPRLGRAAGPNVFPTTTNAATAVAEILPNLKGKLDGMAFRVNTPNVSVVDLVLQISQKTNAEEVNAAFREIAAANPYGLIGVSDEPLTSVDHWATGQSVVDTLMTKVIGEDMLKVVAWYDNEWGFNMNMIGLGSAFTKLN